MPLVVLDWRRWHRLWATLGVPASERLDSLHAEVIARYAEPWRHYHTLQHLAECLTMWDVLQHGVLQHGGLQHDARRFAEGELALWFHDAVYDPHRDDNEAQSAALLAQSASQLGLARSSICYMSGLILLTRHGVNHDSRPGDPDALAVLDADLAILGAKTHRFYEYTEQIRHEYAWIPEETFRAGRIRLLQSLLARPVLYHTDFLRKRLESQARLNLQAAIQALQQEL